MAGACARAHLRLMVPTDGAPPPDPIAALSAALAVRAAACAAFVAAVERRGKTPLSAILWRADLLVTSEQALPGRADHAVLLPDGTAAAARLLGRDPSTNVAVLRLAPRPASDDARADAGPPASGLPDTDAADTHPAEAVPLPPFAPPPPPGSLVLAVGAGPSVRIAAVQVCGPAWRSLAGGMIARKLVLDMTASGREEGGPVLDAEGRLLGMATAGPRGRALVIPHETIAGAVAALLAGGGSRPSGWVGVALQPVEIPAALRGAAGQAAGLMILSLAPEGPAEAAGLLPGDILLDCDGESLASPRAIRGMLGPDKVGQTLAVRLLRAGAVQTLPLPVRARPEGGTCGAG